MTTTTVKPASYEFAEKLFVPRGTDCLGFEQTNQVFGFRLDEGQVPKILFSEDELVRARELGQQLILDVNVKPDGRPLSMRSLQTHLNDRILDGKFLFNTDWYAEGERFFDRQLPIGWRLTGREVIPGSASADYLKQTEAIVSYLRGQVYKEQDLPPLYAAAVAQFETKKTELAGLMRKDWKVAAEQLVTLQINQLFRETPEQVCYRIAFNAGVNRKYLLSNMFTWTKSLSSGGLIVRVGSAAQSGVYVGSGGPGGSDSDLGVCFSRSPVPES